MNIEEIEKEINSIQMQIDLLDHKINTLKRHLEEIMEEKDDVNEKYM